MRAPRGPSQAEPPRLANISWAFAKASRGRLEVDPPTARGHVHRPLFRAVGSALALLDKAGGVWLDGLSGQVNAQDAASLA